MKSRIVPSIIASLSILLISNSYGMEPHQEGSPVLTESELAFNRGLSYEKENNLERAEECYQQAVAHDDTSQAAIKATTNLGVLYQKQSRLDLAERCFAKSASKDAKAALNLGILYIRHDGLDLAQYAFLQCRELLKAEPNPIVGAGAAAGLARIKELRNAQ